MTPLGTPQRPRLSSEGVLGSSFMAEAPGVAEHDVTDSALLIWLGRGVRPVEADNLIGSRHGCVTAAPARARAG